MKKEKTTEKITLKNRYLQGSVTVRAKLTDRENEFYLSRHQVKRMRGILLGPDARRLGCDLIDDEDFALDYLPDGGARLLAFARDYNEAMS